jgi:hypothetical protein
MPKLTVKKQSTLDSKTVYESVKKFLENDSDLKKLDSAYQCKFNDSTLSGTAQGKMFKAEMKVAAGTNGCSVEIVVDLPLTLALAKGMIEKTLQSKLNHSVPS